MFTPLSIMQVIRGRKSICIPDEDSLWLVIDSACPDISLLYKFMDFLKRHWTIEEELFTNIHIAVTEAVINAVVHGNRSSTGKSASICATCDEDYYAFTIEDEGDGFDFLRIGNPTVGENLEKASGRGIYIMRSLADSIHYSEGGRSVKLLFYRR